MKRNKLTPGYYHLDATGGWEKLVKFAGLDDNYGVVLDGRVGIKKSFEVYPCTHTATFDGSAVYTPATSEQIEWFEACIEAEKYIPFEEIVKNQQFIFSI